MNIEVFAHLEVGSGGERVVTQADGGTLVCGGTRAPFAAVFSDATPPGAESVFASVVGPLVQAFVAGCDATLLVLGESSTAKLPALAGRSGDERRHGLVHLAATALFDGDFSPAGPLGVPPADYSTSFWEINDEVITDLSNPDGAEPSIEVDPELGERVGDLTAVQVESTEQCVRAFKVGLSGVASGATKLGPSENRSSWCFSLRRSTRSGGHGDAADGSTAGGDAAADAPPMWSTLSFVHLAGIEALAEDATHVELIGGPNLNRGITAFAAVVRTLADGAARVSEAAYGSSKLTTLLKSAIGGNSQTRALVPIRASNRSGDETNSMKLLELCANLGRVTNHPVVGTAAARGLEARYRRLIAAAAEVGDGGGGGGGGGGSMVIGGRPNLMMLKLEAENKRLHEKLADVGRRYNAALEDKARAATSTLSTEEKRLEVTKALLDVRIEAARVQEEAEATKFEQVNRILELERQVAEMTDAAAAAATEHAAARAQADDLADEAADLRDEMVSLRKSHVRAREELGLEKTRNDELGLELLKAVGAKEAAEKELSALRSQPTAVGAAGVRADQQLPAAAARGSGTAADNDLADLTAALSAQSGDSDALRSDILRLEKQLLTRDQQAQRRQSVQAGATTGRVDLLAERLQKVQDELAESRAGERAAAAAANAARARTREVALQYDAAAAENADLRGKQEERLELYRGRLTKYVHDIGDFVAAAGGEYFPGMETQLKRYVDLMLRDLTETYAHREQQLCASIERRLRREEELTAERTRLQRAYDSCAAQLKTAGMAPPEKPAAAGAGPASAPSDDPLRRGGGSAGDANASAATAVTGRDPEAAAAAAERGASFKDVQRAMTEFTRTTQRKLEQERAGLLIRCTAAEEKVRQMEDYIATKLSAYQEEIVRLRKFAR